MGPYSLFMGFVIYERDLANFFNLWCYVIFFLLKSFQRYNAVPEKNIIDLRQPNRQSFSGSYKR